MKLLVFPDRLINILIRSENSYSFYFNIEKDYIDRMCNRLSDGLPVKDKGFNVVLFDDYLSCSLVYVINILNKSVASYSYTSNIINTDSGKLVEDYLKYSINNNMIDRDFVFRYKSYSKEYGQGYIIQDDSKYPFNISFGDEGGFISFPDISSTITIRNLYSTELIRSMIWYDLLH